MVERVVAGSAAFHFIWTALPAEAELRDATLDFVAGEARLIEVERAINR
jgi:hypothetical protein